ncbi:hypothetical protein JAAARDRAFT_37995 [Jaapia argillacea MUCL 33604]|uniref:Spc7 kinetochore protein domain-containing protein n=1 Tax=Jaapia argillacea MUCL 33604 TaxID=933084 RepID=A0A067PUB3_9AGAM|nr:hypothetical protein JAAARDRAFT_37995 [Jaapia argillacea MUCL 33604]
MVKSNSPNKRRKSIAVPNHKKSSSHKKRPHSLAPGEILSPRARARRVLMPRKSILKSSLNIQPPIDPTLLTSASEEANTLANATIAQTLEFTSLPASVSLPTQLDATKENTNIQTTTTMGPRKSLGRRVTFDGHAYVRVFEVPPKVGFASPASSPDTSPQQPLPPPPVPNAGPSRRSSVGGAGGITNENAYTHQPRRSSLRRQSEGGEMSMELDDSVAFSPSHFLPQPAGEGEGEYDDWDEGEGDESMEITEAIQQSILRRRSVSLGFPSSSRRKSSIAPPPPDDAPTSSDTEGVEGEDMSFTRANPRLPLSQITEADESLDHTSSTTTTSASESESYPMEFTVPLTQSLREPKPPSEAWLALRAVTHGGDEPEPPPPVPSDDEGEEGMELTDALQRLSAARTSFGLEGEDVGGEVSFESTDSFVSDQEPDGEGDRTVNVTGLLRRASGVRFEELGMDEGGDMGEERIYPDLSGFGLPREDGEEGEEEENRTPVAHPANRPVPGAFGESVSGLPVVAPAQSGHSVFSAPSQTNSVFSAPSQSSSVFSAPVPTVPPSVFSPPVPAATSVFSPPPPPDQPAAPKPFAFSFTPRGDSEGNEGESASRSSPGVSGSRSNGKENGDARPVNSETTTSTSVPVKPLTTTQSPFHPPPFKPLKSTPTSQTPKPKPAFTAAFAPPVSVPRPAPLSRPTPNTSRPTPGQKRTAAISGLNFDEAEDGEKPSPKKKVAFGGGRDSPVSSGVGAVKTPGRLSPSKRAPFEAASTTQGGIGARRASVGGRRPPGYLAHRRSLGGVLSLGPNSVAGQNQEGGVNEKMVGMTRLGRASVGSTSVSAEEPLAPLPPAMVDKPASPVSKGKGKEVEMRCEREFVRQNVAVPSPTRGSPSPVSLASPRRSGSPVSRIAPLAVPSHVTATPVELEGPMVVDITFDEEDEVEVNPTEQWRMDVEAAGPAGLEAEPFEEDEGPAISIEQFLTMTGIKFMDELTVPRRSTIHRSALQPRDGKRRRSSSSTGEGAEEDEEEVQIPLAEYVTAMTVDVPQLELYLLVAKDLRAWIEHGKVNFKQAEEEVAKVTPELFKEFSSCDEEDRLDFQQTLKLIKAYAHASARSQWYDWKLSWVQGLHEKAEEGFSQLESDAKVLENIIKDAQDVIPSLQEEYDQIMRELEKEQAEVEQIQNCDQGHLADLKAAIAEQESILDVFRSDISESNAKLERIQDKLSEIEAQNHEATEAIAEGQRKLHIQKNGTQAEVFKLRDELDVIDELHMLRILKVKHDLMEFVYASTLRVTVPCVKFKPIQEEVTIVRVDDPASRRRDTFPQLSDFMLRTVRHQITNRKDTVNVRQIYQILADTCSACAQFRTQLNFLAIKFPTSIEINPPTGSDSSQLRVKVVVLFRKTRAKAVVSYILDKESLASWPMSIGSIVFDVKVVYGDIEAGTILNAVRSRMHQANPADNHGCMMDACIEAAEQYE